MTSLVFIPGEERGDLTVGYNRGVGSQTRESFAGVEIIVIQDAPSTVARELLGSADLLTGNGGLVGIPFVEGSASTPGFSAVPVFITPSPPVTLPPLPVTVLQAPLSDLTFASWAGESPTPLFALDERLFAPAM